MKIRISNVFFIFLFFIMFIVSVQAKSDVTLTLDNSDYTFNVGDNAIINLESINTYGKDISGNLRYTITQKVQQAGFQYSSSNTQSTPFVLPEGTEVLQLNFGTSKSPVVLEVDLQFNYNDGTSKVVDLDTFRIHFVENNNNQNNNQNSNNNNQNNNNNNNNNKISSSSEKVSSSNQKSNPSQDPFAQQDKMMQQLMQQMQGNSNPNPSNNMNQKLQNQLPQDSSALKQQMQKQIKEQEEVKNQFKNNLESNSDFQKQHQEMLKQGFNLSNANLNPQNNNTGDFDLEYKNDKGETAKLSGSMQNNSLKNVKKETPQMRSDALSALQNDSRFKKLSSDLDKDNFKLNDSQVNFKENQTEVQLSYNDEFNNTATITAKIENNSVDEIILEKDSDVESKSYLWLLLLLFLFLLGLYYFYKKRKQKNNVEVKEEVKVIRPKFNYKLESNKLLSKAIKQFKEDNFKDAYMNASRSLRLFLSYKYSLNKEVTSDDIIVFLKTNKLDYGEIKECFDLCSLVEFAKYTANKSDFDRIVSLVKSKIK